MPAESIERSPGGSPAERWRRLSDELRTLLLAEARPGGDVEVVTPGSAVTALALGSAAAVTHELLSLEPRQLPDSGGAVEVEIAIEVDRGLAARGVRQRLVLGQPLRTRDDIAGVEAIIEAGDAPRYHPAVPLRLLVHDRRLAFVALDPAHTRDGAFVVRRPQLVDTARDLFEDVWTNSGPLPVWLPAEPGSPEEVLEHEVLRLLAEGLKDDAIARRLGLSDRTVRRTVAALQKQYGAGSRFQLALLAGENRALPSQPSRPHDPR